MVSTRNQSKVPLSSNSFTYIMTHQIEVAEYIQRVDKLKAQKKEYERRIKAETKAKKSQVESHTPDFNESNYDFEIDFEESLRMWNKNKRKIGNGQYKYICGKTLDNGTSCKNPRNCRVHKNTTWF